MGVWLRLNNSREIQMYCRGQSQQVRFRTRKSHEHVDRCLAKAGQVQCAATPARVKFPEIQMHFLIWELGVASEASRSGLCFFLLE
jgi:hypothetical protein